MAEKYPLPDIWCWVRLGEVCRINPPRSKNFSRSPDAPTTFVPMAAVNEKVGAIANPEIVPYSKVCRGYTYFEENDVLFAKITPCMQNSKHVIARNLIDKMGFGTTEFHVLRADEEILPEWIHYFIRQPRFLEEAKAYFTGTVGQQRIPDNFLKDYLIPLPSIDEQRRIAAKLQEMMQEVERARTACEKQLEAAKALPAAYLRQVLESEEAKKWERKRLGEVCEVFSGTSAPQGKQYFEDGIFPFVRVQDLGHYGRTISLTETFDKVNKKAVSESKLKLAKSGTILFPKSGAAILTNSRAILGIDAYVVSHLAALYPKIDLALTEWVYFCLCQVDMVEYSENPGYPSLKLSVIAKISIPLPPISEQQRIATDLKEKMAQVEKLRASIENQLEAINALPQAILRKAFRGEL